MQNISSDLRGLRSQRTEIKYNLHYGLYTGRRFTASTRFITSCSEVKKQKLVREKKAIDEEKQKLNKSGARLTQL